MNIFAIGGGELRSGETAPMDRRIVELTGKSRPHALFLPTASFDSREYASAFASVYGDLGCETESLFLWDGFSREEIEETIQRTKWNSEPHAWDFRGSDQQVREAVERCDLVYVGGGNTRRLMELWKSIGLDEMLREAGERGVVLSGVSAGCICWARYGNSDAALTEDMGKPTMRIDCLGFLPIALCPHMSHEGFRLEEFRAMMRETPGVGIGLDDGCALEVVDEECRFITSMPGAVAHRMVGGAHEVVDPTTTVTLAELASPERRL